MPQLSINRTKQIITTREYFLRDDDFLGNQQPWRPVALVAFGVLGGLHCMYSLWACKGYEALDKFAIRLLVLPQFALIEGAVVAAIGFTAIRVTEMVFNNLRANFYASLNSKLYSSDALLKGLLLERTLSYKVNFDIKGSLLAEMDFDQLGEARRILGSKKFGQLTQYTSTQPIQVWRQIGNIGGETTLQGMLNALSRLQPPEKDDPYALSFATNLEKEIQIRQPKIYQEFRERLWQDYPYLRKVRVEVEGYPPFEIKAAAVNKLEGSILDQYLFEGKIASGNLPPKITLSKDLLTTKQDYESYCRIFKLLGGESYNGNLSMWLDDIKNADTRFGQIAVEELEKELTTLPFPAVLENYEAICSFYVDTLKEVPLHLQRKLYQLYQAKIPRTEKEDIAFEERYCIYKLLRPEAASITQNYGRNQTIENFKMCFLALPMEDFQIFFKDEMITTQNLKPLYSYFSLARGSGAQKVVDGCKRLTQSLTADERNIIFGYRQTPPDLLKPVSSTSCTLPVIQSHI